MNSPDPGGGGNKRQPTSAGTGSSGQSRPARTASKQLSRRPLSGPSTAIHGRVKIRIERCKGCKFCVEFCPQGVLAWSKEFNKKGYHYPLVVKDVCIRCSLCATLCPDYAIYSVQVDDAAPEGMGRNHR